MLIDDATDRAVIAPEEVGDPLAVPQVLDGDLSDRDHGSAALRTRWVDRALNPGRLAADPVQILAIVGAGPVLQPPAFAD